MDGWIGHTQHCRGQWRSRTWTRSWTWTRSCCSVAHYTFKCTEEEAEPLVAKLLLAVSANVVCICIWQRGASLVRQQQRRLLQHKQHTFGYFSRPGNPRLTFVGETTFQLSLSTLTFHMEASPPSGSQLMNSWAQRGERLLIRAEKPQSEDLNSSSWRSLLVPGQEGQVLTQTQAQVVHFFFCSAGVHVCRCTAAVIRSVLILRPSCPKTGSVQENGSALIHSQMNENEKAPVCEWCCWKCCHCSSLMQVGWNNGAHGLHALWN